MKERNPNHPKKGSTMTVDPIRDLKAIGKIKRKLKKGNPRDYLLFVMGINNGLRISDLLKLKFNRKIYSVRKIPCINWPISYGEKP